MFINKNNVICNIKGLDMIINTENGAVVGVDRDNLQSYKKLINEELPISLDKELYDFLIENEFVSNQPLEKKEIEIPTAYLHVTNRCNLHCLGCYSDNDSRNIDSDLEFKDMIKVLNELERVGIKNLVISGGEPLLRKDIVDLMKYAKEKCEIERLTLITNGTVGNMTLFSRLSQYLDNISVSLDTFDSKCKAFLRDEGIFDNIIKNIYHMKNAGLNVAILPTIHHKNVSYISRYNDLADKLDVAISFSIFTTGCEKIYEDYSLLNDDLSHISKYLSSCKIEDIPINNTLEGKRHCGTGCNILSVGADGDVYPCHMLMEEQFKMGNIVNNDMITILENNKTNRKCWENDVDDISGCRQCTYKYLCGGGCRARAHLINGNIMKKDPFCKMFKGFYDEIFATMRNKKEE
ncbi:radical SAM/SPASM domain-containing protein [Kandleria vitulina]|uniref:radical SAM/SPASM domain-containing protein n=1 Tax=Kandleria vitulina TaxID=1630 RepID=UPI000490AA9B|nr:radical SAM protein [Kandleria vitulina]